MPQDIPTLDFAQVESARDQIKVVERALRESDEIATRSLKTIAESKELIARADEMLKKR